MQSMTQVNVSGRPTTTSVGRRARTSKAKSQRRGGARRRSIAPYLFVAPYVLFLVSFAIAPALYGLYTSLFTTPRGRPREFDPAANWSSVIDDYRLPESAANVGTYLGLWMPAMVLFIFVAALTMHARPGRFADAMRLTYYLPGAITGSAAALLWLFMVSPGFSPFGPVLDLFGIGSASEFIGKHATILISIMGIAMHAGGWILIVYAALTALPKDVMDAARVDGASAWQLALRVKLPMVRRYIVLILITTFAAGTQVFAEPMVLAQGVPGQISGTWSLNQLAYYYATTLGDFGRAAALSLMLLVVGLVVALVVIYRTKFYRIERGEGA